MSTSTIKITIEDRVKLTQDQINLIQLAFKKQIPPEDADFMERVQKDSIKKMKSQEQVFVQLSEHFVEKYGIEFGMLLLTAIIGGKVQYEVAKKSIERQKANERISKES